MEQSNKNIGNISRKQFLRNIGSVVAGGSIVGVTVLLAGRMIARPKEVCRDNPPEDEFVCSACNKVRCPLRKGVMI